MNNKKAKIFISGVFIVSFILIGLFFSAQSSQAACCQWSYYSCNPYACNCRLECINYYWTRVCDTCYGTCQVCINNYPVANAGPNKEVWEGEKVKLQGSGSDPDRDRITYRWSCNGGSLSNPNIAQPNYTAPLVDSDTTYTCTLTVTDNKGCSHSDSMNVLVGGNKPPDSPGIPSTGPGSGVDIGNGGTGDNGDGNGDNGDGWVPLDPFPAGEEWNHCSIQGLSIPTFYWTYSDPDGDPQTAYEIRIDDDASFPPTPTLDEFTDSGGAATAYTPIPSAWRDWMDWRTNYWWIVRVKDDHGNWSAWSAANKFRTPNHAYPWADFFFTPAEPSQNEVVIFDPDTSQVYGGASIATYLWAVTEGTGTFVDETGIASQYPHIVFTTQINKVRLGITDSDGYFCECVEKGLTAELPLPEYREVPPIIWLQKVFAGVIDFFNGFLNF